MVTRLAAEGLTPPGSNLNKSSEIVQMLRNVTNAIVLSMGPADAPLASRKPRLLKRWEVAELLGVSPNTVSRWAREGRLPSVLTLGGHRRFASEDVEKLVRRGPAGPRGSGQDGQT